MSKRGSAIRFFAGKYEGCTGWFNMANAHTTSMYYVIVTDENGEEKSTRVRKASVITVADERVPVSYEEDMFVIRVYSVVYMARRVHTFIYILIY
jgi:hypothetical protein